MRTNGILNALSSLPSEYGVGGFGKEANEFIDILSEAHISIWQLLPLNPTGFGNSPYQSVCGEAIDPIYVDILDLVKKYNIKKPASFNAKKDFVDYEKCRKVKEKALRNAFDVQKDTDSKEFAKFLKDNKWCEVYAKFNCLSIKNKGKEWWEWTTREKNAFYKDLGFKKYSKEILYYEWVQFVLFNEFYAFKEYANKKNVRLMGDIPFYVGGNSSDVWSNQDDFDLDKNSKPNNVAGVPPDYFAKTGQRWGNPIYDWDYMKDDGYTFWIDRMKYMEKMYDLVRVDHFRAFDTYYVIPSSCETAEIGKWHKAYGEEVLAKLIAINKDSEIVAEDLGDLVPSVLELRDKFNLKGMNVLEFNILTPGLEPIKNQIIYTGTHDNETLVSWYRDLTYEQKEQISVLLRVNRITTKEINKKFIELAFSSQADYCIIPVWDYLGLDKDSRMNTPGTVGSPNWEFKLVDFDDLKSLIPYINSICKKYHR